MSSVETVVAVRGVVNRFGAQVVHDGVSLEVHKGETRDFRAEDHLASFAGNAPDLRLDYVLADPSVVPDASTAFSPPV